VSDIFREVDEELRRERLQKLWERYGTFTIAAAVLLIAAVGGWRAYEWYEAKQAAQAGTAFEAAMTLSEQGNLAEAEAAFAKLATDGTASYRMLAKLNEAADLAKRDAKAAVALYDSLAADPNVSRVFQDLATLRAGFILVDTATYEDLRQRMEPLTAPDRTFRNSARSLMALAAWRANDFSAMRRWSEMVLADADAPAGARSQVQMLMAISASGRS
jgi:hypothetical protein